MDDYQAIVDNIRSYLRAGSFVTHSEALSDLAARYASFCREANVRLRRCSEYLRRGCISEAVHLAACQPTLDRLVSCLQLPEIGEWNALCARLGLQQAASLVTEDLDALQSAQAVEQKLDPLLARHRMLAIARAPVRERLQIVRLLQEHDADNTCWSEEARRLEEVRLTEIQAELGQTVKQSGDPKYDELVAELSGPWQVSLPFELGQLLRPLGSAHPTEAAAEQLNEIEHVLLDEDLVLAPPEIVEAAIAQWEQLEPEVAQTMHGERIAGIREAIAQWREAEASRKVAEHNSPSIPTFQQSGSVPHFEDPESRVQRRRIILIVLLLGTAIAAYVFHQLNPDALPAVRKFIGL
jgi:hypothetical protein